MKKTRRFILILLVLAFVAVNVVFIMQAPDPDATKVALARFVFGGIAFVLMAVGFPYLFRVSRK